MRVADRRLAYGAQAVVIGREAPDRRVDAGAWSERGADSASGRRERNQVFLWRRAYRNGELQPGDSAALVPVVIEAEASDGMELGSELEAGQAGPEQLVTAPASGSIHIELPGRAAIPGV